MRVVARAAAAAIAGVLPMPAGVQHVVAAPPQVPVDLSITPSLAFLLAPAPTPPAPPAPPAPPPDPPAPVAAAAAAEPPVSDTPAPAPVPSPASSGDINAPGVWQCIGMAESSDNPSADTGNGYFGLYQFDPNTWNWAVAGAGYASYANGRADLAPADVQLSAAEWLAGQDGFSPWPETSVACGV
ncbi:MAG: transglycosylase family protein [Acidimicrobiales bacterium]